MILSALLFFFWFFLRCLRRPNKKHSARSEMAGLFFCLAPADGAGLFFLPDSVSATHKRLQRLFCRPCNYTATETKPFTELCSGFSVNLTHSSAHNTIDTQAAYTPPAQHRRHTVKRSTCTNIRYHRRAERHTDQHNRPIIIRYIRVQLCALLWIHARRCIIAQTMPARRPESWHVLA